MLRVGTFSRPGGSGVAARRVPGPCGTSTGPKLSIDSGPMTTVGTTQQADTARPMRIADVARRAGVSVPTVSKVINGRADVAVETRRRVEAVIREWGYERTRRPVRPARLLELVFNELDSEWALEIVMGAERVARENDMALVLSEMEGHHRPRRGWMESVLARRPMGVLAVLLTMSETQRAQLKSRGIPLVIVDPTGEPLHDTPSVGATNWSGGLAATRHLLGLGHRRIAVIGGPEAILCSRARLDGYRAAMDEAGVPIDPRLVRNGSFQVEDGVAAARALFRLPVPDRPTAIFAGNDQQALGVYQAAREARLHIPDDLSVVGFDDLPVASWVGPPLTTVRQPLASMAMAAARLVLRLAAGDEPAQTRIELSTELVVRESTAPLATRN
jgi:LacI family xylobiose transport system transcriptional regulator